VTGYQGLQPMNSTSHRARWRTLCVAATLALFALPVAAAQTGWFGLKLSVDAEDSPGHALRSITVVSVVADSPASRAGLGAGDLVVAIGDMAVSGARAEALKPLMDKAVGETLRLTVQRGNAASREVTMVAAQKPANLP
jgi:C-terminal processing protease CtpA/Prc